MGNGRYHSGPRPVPPSSGAGSDGDDAGPVLELVHPTPPSPPAAASLDEMVARMQLRLDRVRQDLQRLETLKLEERRLVAALEAIRATE